MKVSRDTPLEELPALVSAREVAAWLGIGTGTVYELIRRRDLPSVRLGRLVRIPRAALARMAGIVAAEESNGDGR